jgi:hypothetical protein
MKRHVSADDLKESLRGYGAFVAQGERDEGNTQSTEQVQPFQIMLAFETKASSLSTRFSGDEFRSVMEGMMDRKGVEYCKAVAGEMSAKNLSELLSSYVDRFSLFFSSASDQVVQGVIRELLRLNKCPKDELCKILVDSFMNIYQSKKQFSVFAPLLGTQIMVQRPVAKEAMDRSLKDKYGQVRFDSCTNVWSSVDKDTVLNIKVSQALQQIEKDIVTKMLTQGSHFPQFYGRFIAQKIKQGVGAPETLKKTYTDFITKNFAQNFDEQSRIMKTVMQKELAPPSPQRSPLRTATPQAWQEDGDI